MRSFGLARVNRLTVSAGVHELSKVASSSQTALVVTEEFSDSSVQRIAYT
jgi:hypothetical protein